MELDEAGVEAFLAKFKASDNDKRVDQVQLFGVQLEATPSLPASTLDAITLLLCPTLRSTNHLLVQSTLTSVLPVFIPHLPIDHPPHAHLRLALTQYLPPLLEKLNDPKEKIASPARTSIALLGKKCFEAEAGQAKEALSTKGKEKEGLVAIWERQVKDAALAGKGWRGKSEGMKLIVSLRNELGNKMSLRPWLATLVELLEDGDSHVRETSRETIVALLSPASTPHGARTELKKLLQAHHIRASIADNIITRIFSANSAAATPASEVPPNLDDGSGSSGRSGAATPASDDVSVVYVASARDLEGEFARMLPYFQGKEDEHNWNPRERSIIRVRGMLRGQAFQQYPEAFVAGLKSGFFEGLSRTVVSLRTTVAQQSCALLQELAEQLGSALDPFVENLLPVLAKMAGYTKKLIADKSQRCLTAVLVNSTAHPRLFIHHIHAGIQDKNVQTRQYSTTHLKTFLDSQASKTRQTIEHTGGLLDQLCESTKKALVDVNPGVREVARPAYWSLHAIWPAKSTPIAEQLDAAQKKQLEKVRPDHAAPIPATRPPIGAAKKSSGIGALLAEKRKAAMAARRESARTVSSPVPASPSLAQTRAMPRATSSQHPGHAYEEDEDDANDAAPALTATPTRDATASTQLAPTPNGAGADDTSPAQSSSRPHDRTPSKEPKSSSSSSTSSHGALQTPDTSEGKTSSLLNVEHDQRAINPVTPMRPSRSAAQELLYRTPMHGLNRDVWADSPGPSTVTPLMMDKLKGRRYERSWWLKRQQYLDKASPLRTNAPTPASAIEDDVSALRSGAPVLRNLQKLTLFSTSHPLDGDGDMSGHEATWTSGRLFDRIFDNLIGFLRPDRDADLLEHGLVLLWELVQHQWSMVEDKESMLVDALFTLRSTKNATILESTNSLISLLAEISDPVYLLGLLRSSLERYIDAGRQVNGNVNGDDTARVKAQASGYLLGLNGMGMCILRLPPPVVEVEAPKLMTVVMSAVADSSTAMLPARQAVHHLLLCTQCVLKDARRTLAIFPNLPEAQQNLAMYLMEQNGLLPGGAGSPEKVMHEMAGLMSRGTA